MPQSKAQGRAAASATAAAAAVASAPCASVLASDSGEPGTPMLRRAAAASLGTQAGSSSSEFERLMRESVESNSGGVDMRAAQPLSSPRVADPPSAAPGLSATKSLAVEPFATPPPAASTALQGATASPATDPWPGSSTGRPGVTASPSVAGERARAASPEEPLGRAQFSGCLEEPWAHAELSGRLEDITRELRRSVQHEFVLAERAMLARYRATSEAQRLKAEAAACQQQALIEALQAKEQQLSRRLELKQRQLKGSLALLQRTRGGLAGRCALELSLRTWAAAAAAGKDARLHELLTARLHRARLEGIIFGSWCRATQASRREALVAHERGVAEMVRSKCFEQMELDKERLVVEAERLRRQLFEESQQRALMQENLKRVFMRGVCALNFEAMSLLRDPAGTSPGSAGVVDAQAPELGLVADVACSGTSESPQTVEGDDAGHTFAAPVLPMPMLDGGAVPAASIAACSLGPAPEVAEEAAPPATPALGEAPRQAPVPLPFVNYSAPRTPGPGLSAVRVAAGGGPGLAPGARQACGAPPKGLRWQPAPVPRVTASASALGATATAAAQKARAAHKAP